MTLDGEAPRRGEIMPLPLQLMVHFKAGDVTDSRELVLYLTGPSGSREPLPGLKVPQVVPFEGGDTGVSFVTRLDLKYEGEGTYWIDVVLDGELRSRIPLTLVVRNEPAQASSGGAAGGKAGRTAAAGGLAGRSASATGRGRR